MRRRCPSPPAPSNSPSVPQLGLAGTALIVSLAACTSEPSVVQIDVITGHETDAMTAAPAVENVVVRGVPCEGCEAGVIEAEAAPGGALDFGEVDEAAAYTFEVTGTDGAGNTVLRGRSYGRIVLGQLSGGGFSVFAQRLGAWARPPGELARAHTRAPAVTIDERYLLTSGGDPGEDASEVELYDILSWGGAKGEVPFSFSPQTLRSSLDENGSFQVLALGGADSAEAESLGLVNGALAVEPVTLPEGLESFGEVGGGRVIPGPTEGRAFIVGATREGAPTDAVIDVDDARGTVTVRRLVQARAGAAAAWVDDVGLVIAGGSAEGPGVEVLGEDATKFALRDFPPDATSGAGAVASSVGLVMLIGGATGGAPAKTRTFDPKCSSDCAFEEQDALTPDGSLARVMPYFWEAGKVLVVGDDMAASGLTRTFLIGDLEGTVTELPLREPRRFATSLPAPNGTLTLLGGVHEDGTPALTVEMFFPE